MRDWLARRAADVLPHRVAYWMMIKVGVKHCGGPDHPMEEIPAVPFMVVLQRMGR